VSGGFLVGGGLVFTFLSSVLKVPSEFTLILGGLGLIVASVRNPEGVAGAVRHLGLSLRGKRAPTSAPTSGGH
jgi:hypothetical protein